ncbi:unnamed protein product, partial [Didymodactylos carnosus]
DCSTNNEKVIESLTKRLPDMNKTCFSRKQSINKKPSVHSNKSSPRQQTILSSSIEEKSQTVNSERTKSISSSSSTGVFEKAKQFVCRVFRGGSCETKIIDLTVKNEYQSPLIINSKSRKRSMTITNEQSLKKRCKRDEEEEIFCITDQLAETSPLQDKIDLLELAPIVDIWYECDANFDEQEQNVITYQTGINVDAEQENIVKNKLASSVDFHARIITTVDQRNSSSNNNNEQKRMLDSSSSLFSMFQPTALPLNITRSYTSIVKKSRTVSQMSHAEPSNITSQWNETIKTHSQQQILASSISTNTLNNINEPKISRQSSISFNIEFQENIVNVAQHDQNSVFSAEKSNNMEELMPETSIPKPLSTLISIRPLINQLNSVLDDIDAVLDKIEIKTNSTLETRNTNSSIPTDATTSAIPENGSLAFSENHHIEVEQHNALVLINHREISAEYNEESENTTTSNIPLLSPQQISFDHINLTNFVNFPLELARPLRILQQNYQVNEEIEFTDSGDTTHIFNEEEFEEEEDFAEYLISDDDFDSEAEEFERHLLEQEELISTEETDIQQQMTATSSSPMNGAPLVPDMNIQEIQSPTNMLYQEITVPVVLPTSLQINQQQSSYVPSHSTSLNINIDHGTEDVSSHEIQRVFGSDTWTQMSLNGWKCCEDSVQLNKRRSEEVVVTVRPYSSELLQESRNDELNRVGNDTDCSQLIDLQRTYKTDNNRQE